MFLKKAIGKKGLDVSASNPFYFGSEYSLFTL